MENKEYLTFRLHDLQYGIEAVLVQEVFPLPELTPISEATTDIIGILNVRGQIVPIIHLDLLLSNPVKNCNFSDYVVVMQWEDSLIGMVVHQVDEVLELNSEVITTKPSYDFFNKINTKLIAGIASLDSGNIVLLNTKTLIREPDAVLTLIWDAQTQIDSIGTSTNSQQQLEQQLLPGEKELLSFQSLPSFYDLYCPNATPDERNSFRQRADSLKPQTESVKTSNELMSLAVIGFGNEVFGVDLGLVREFTDIGNLTPIPCCPSHIVGNMNLRGEIVTLVDIRKVLNLPTAPVSIGDQAIVVQVDDIVAGLPVERVLELVSVNATELTPLPPPLSELGENYLQGIVSSEEKIMKVLDLPKLFTEGELVVNDDA
ncbi:chemotaxis protein CheW [Allocoleopsis sp.]|uniref:chemotaxis protein CheW n=1 Tax=Allocoleopsis sp. TaxID=3088169 RepID=UPI002FD0C934